MLNNKIYKYIKKIIYTVNIKGLKQYNWLFFFVSIGSYMLIPLSVTVGGIIHDNLPLMKQIITQINEELHNPSKEHLANLTYQNLLKHVPDIIWDNNTTIEKWEAIRLILSDYSERIHDASRAAILKVYNISEENFNSPFNKINSYYKLKCHLSYNHILQDWYLGEYLNNKMPIIIAVLQENNKSLQEVRGYLEVLENQMAEQVHIVPEIAHKYAQELKYDDSLPAFNLKNGFEHLDRKVYQDPNRGHKECLFSTVTVLIIGGVINHYMG
ncbi:MAG: hypothetical protein CMP47_01930 [Rickettsiales bacterium]|nr:hypothetical protein [Rickettsiales bacterium]